jgi:exopolysaccharide biosynthesis protein
MAKTKTGPAVYETKRLRLDDGAVTRIHILKIPRAGFTGSVVTFPRPQRLTDWCHESDIRYAIGGGFFDRLRNRPLGELRSDGALADHTPFSSQWRDFRGTIHFDGAVRIAARRELPDQPTGSLMQAGPILLRDGTVAVQAETDSEGFAADSSQFDGDITSRRFQRAAIGLSADHFILLAADGACSDPAFAEASENAGLTLEELAGALKDSGAIDALNLDGGGSTSLVHDEKLVNQPLAGAYDDVSLGTVMPEGRPIYSAIIFS